MSQPLARIAFTPNVRAVQAQMGSRAGYQSLDDGDEPEVAALGRNEIDFIAARDSFYQGTVGEDGWPYVQHRGGPPGFLKVLHARTLGYADFSGNRQYISVGNLNGNDRVSLFLMDYAAQRRLKIWGRARIVDERDDPDLIAKLESPHYRARIERAVVITIEAFDWNCPKYITRRFTEQDVAAMAEAWQRDGGPAEVQAAANEELGSGPLQLVVTGIRQLTPRVRAYELRAPDGGTLPDAAAGSHLAVPVRLADGSVVTRTYSLTHPAQGLDRYEIAVLNEHPGEGASSAIHANWKIGTRLRTDNPVNQFPLHAGAGPAVLIAGGIGITPIMAMAQELKERGNGFELHYSAATPVEAAYREALLQAFPDQLRLYFSRSSTRRRIDLGAVLRAAPQDALFYVCGPARLIDAALAAAREAGIGPERMQFESFT